MSPLEPEEEAIEADEGALPSQEQTRELGPDLGLRHRAGSSDGISGMKAAEFVCMWFAGTAPTLSKQHALKGKNCVSAFEAVASAEELQFLRARGADRNGAEHEADARATCRRLEKRLKERFVALCARESIPVPASFKKSKAGKTKALLASSMDTAFASVIQKDDRAYPFDKVQNVLEALRRSPPPPQPATSEPSTSTAPSPKRMRFNPFGSQ